MFRQATMSTFSLNSARNATSKSSSRDLFSNSNFSNKSKTNRITSIQFKVADVELIGFKVRCDRRGFRINQSFLIRSCGRGRGRFSFYFPTDPHSPCRSNNFQLRPSPPRPGSPNYNYRSIGGRISGRFRRNCFP